MTTSFPLYSGDCEMSTSANSGDPAAFYQGLHCLLGQNDLQSRIYTFTWEILSIRKFSRGFHFRDNAKFRENKTITIWRDHIAVY